MQTLGLSAATPRTESRLKSLFWPSIESAADVDYLAAQGYWVCTILAVISFIFAVCTGHPVLGSIVLLLFYLGGVGVRERSHLAAAIVLVFYLTDSLLSLHQLVAAPGLIVLRVIFMALLLSNLRAVWMISEWKPGSEEAALPPRLNDTWSDKFADRWPAVLWPKVRLFYYAGSVCLLVCLSLGLLVAFAVTQAKTLERVAHQALTTHNYKEAAKLYQVVTLLRPKQVEAWDNLGNAYSGDRQPAKAVRAYQHAIALSPSDWRAWNGLGHAYIQQQQFEPAIAAYRRLLELNPLNQAALTALGHVLLRAHHYPEAVAELEEANGIMPNDSTLMESLGEAYLRTGQLAKAMALFDKVLKQAPTPHNWNSVAYSLADTGQRLDLARQYAELAVSKTEADLRDTRSLPVTPEGVALSSSLASYWDTLGWVYFQQGELKNAERYVTAAWNHADHGEIGWHLGNIYEKQGNRQQAIATYAAVAGAAYPYPEALERLKQLAGSATDHLIAQQETASGNEHVQKLAWTGIEGTGHVLLAMDASGHVANARFLNGPPKIRAHEAELDNLNFNLPFPDSSTEVFFHRAKVDCSRNQGCELTLSSGSGTPAIIE
jgi:tetratricopeptide (TPR) repeat protein